MQTIDTQTLEQKLDGNNNFVFLNVLPKESYQKEHIKGSDNIPYDDENFVEKVSEKAIAKDTEIIVYCQNTDCPASDKAAQKLIDAGYTNVKDYEAGIEAWKEADNAIAA